MNVFFEKEYGTPHGVFPFDRLSIDDYLPAIKEGIKEDNKDIDDIVTLSDTPTFANTIEPFERSGALLNRVESIFFNLLEAESSDAMQKLAEEISDLLSEHSNDIFLNESLFEKVKYVYDHKPEDLSKEESTLLENVYSSFVRNGAELSPADKRRFRECSKKLSSLSIRYGQNLLNATNSFSLLVTDKNELEGLSDHELSSAHQRATEKGKDGYLFDLSFPCYSVFMKYVKNRKLRCQMYMGYNSKAFGGEFDNTQIVKELVNTRLELVKILGYDCYASYVLKRRMAQNSDNVYKLLDDLLEAYRKTAHDEYSEVEQYAKSLDQIDELKPWDWSFYSNKLRLTKFNFDEEKLRPYFPLEYVKKGVLGLATRLYGLTFRLNKDIPVYCRDEVEAYEVFDEDKSFLATLYIDYFPRNGKQNGAWMTEFCGEHIDNGRSIRPQVSIVMNLTKPSGNRPSLLSINEVSTFLHEFGHAIHGMVANTKYESISGTNVYRDFVELPSQLMENWATEKEFLDTFARHYQTGENIPADLLESIKAERNFNVGYATLRQLSFGYLDMAWHTLKNPFDGDVKQFEDRAISQTLLSPSVDGTLTSTQFSHIFDGGYAAGYYGYKWAEVLDADAFYVFKEHGIFDRQTANRFRRKVLEKGGTEPPMDLYVDFRGEKPNIKYLLMRTGIDDGNVNGDGVSK